MLAGQSLMVIAVLLNIAPALADCRRSPLPGPNEPVEHQQSLSTPLSPERKPIPCAASETDFVLSAQGRTFLAPCRFITETTRHLHEILRSKSVASISAIHHIHLGVADEAWNTTYRDMPAANALPALLRDPALVAIYHSACETLPVDDNRAAKNPRDINRTLHFAGFYDGRPIARLPHSKSGPEADRPQYYHLFTWIYLLVHPGGAVKFVDGEENVALEFHIDTDSAHRDSELGSQILLGR